MMTAPRFSEQYRADFIEPKALELATLAQRCQWDELQRELAQVLSDGDAAAIVRAFQLIRTPTVSV